MVETVLVTGLSGFIARHVALALLREGYAVRGTVRSVAKASKLIEGLAAHGAEASRISLVEADLGKDRGWKEAAKGCSAVMHVASPFPMAQPRDRNALTPAAKGGAVRVIDAALDAGAERIVMTSSMVAMMYRANRPAEFPVREGDWTDVSWKVLSAYVVSKTEAERAAWARVEERGARGKLATVNPGLVLGPVLDKEFGTSIELIRLFMTGAYPALPPIAFPVVDVRDVAALHVRALNVREAGGRRLIAAADTMSMKEIAAILREAAPDRARKIPTSELPAFMVRFLANLDRNMAAVLQDMGARPRPDTGYVRDLTGVSFRPGRDAVAATVASLKEIGAV